MCPTMNDLDDYSLLNIFNYLNVSEKIAIERVSKRWQGLVGELLKKQTGLKLARIPDHLTCNDPNHSTKGGDIYEYINYRYEGYKVKKILTLLMRKKCPNIKCVELEWNWSEMDESVRHFCWFIWMCPKLECFRVYLKNRPYNHGFGKGMEMSVTEIKHLLFYQSKNWSNQLSNLDFNIDKMPKLETLVLLGIKVVITSDEITIELNVKLNNGLKLFFTQPKRVVFKYNKDL